MRCWPAAQGFISVIDAVLLPLDPRSFRDVGKEAYALPGECMTEAHAVYAGDVIKEGRDHVVGGGWWVVGGGWWVLGAGCWVLGACRHQLVLVLGAAAQGRLLALGAL
jgi:hypothetical protein